MLKKVIFFSVPLIPIHSPRIKGKTGVGDLKDKPLICIAANLGTVKILLYRETF
jgi:hypothetical protein